MLKRLVVAACFGIALVLSSQSAFAKEPLMTDEQVEELARHLSNIAESIKSLPEELLVETEVDEYGIKRVLVIIPLVERTNNYQFFKAFQAALHAPQHPTWVSSPNYRYRFVTTWEIGSKKVDLKLVVKTRTSSDAETSDDP